MTKMRSLLIRIGPLMAKHQARYMRMLLTWALRRCDTNAARTMPALLDFSASIEELC